MTATQEQELEAKIPQLERTVLDSVNLGKILDVLEEMVRLTESEIPAELLQKEILLQFGKLDEIPHGFEYFLESLINSSIIKTPSSLNELLPLYFQRGIKNFKNKNYKSALSIFLKIKNLSKTTGNIKLLASTLLQLGHLYKTIGNLYRSRLAYKDALRMFQQLKDEPNIAETAASLAALEILQGRTTDARNHLTQAREYYESEGKPKAVQKIDDLFEAADYVDGAQMVQGRADGVLV